LAAGGYNVQVGVVGGCSSTIYPVTLTAPIAPAWTVTYDCGTNNLVFGGATASLVSYSVNGGSWIPIATPSGLLPDSATPYTIRVNYTTGGSHYCIDSKPVTVSCVHHCALSHGYWKNKGAWFNLPCQHFKAETWCGWTYWDLLSKTPSSIPADARAKFLAGRQYVTFVLTMYYYTPTITNVLTASVDTLVQKGVPLAVAQAAYALEPARGCSGVTDAQYATYGSTLDVFNSHEVDDIYVQNVECDPKITVTPPSCGRSTLVQEMRQK